MDNARSLGKTTNCHGCRFWSELIARSLRGCAPEAMCLAPKSPHYTRYTTRDMRCSAWAEGSLGAIDDPGGNPYEADA